MNRNACEVWFTVVFMRVSDKRKYWELIHYFSIKYAIKNDKYHKTLQEAVYVRRKVRSKVEKNNNKSSPQK